MILWLRGAVSLFYYTNPWSKSKRGILSVEVVIGALQKWQVTETEGMKEDEKEEAIILLHILQHLKKGKNCKNFVFLWSSPTANRLGGLISLHRGCSSEMLIVCIPRRWMDLYWVSLLRIARLDLFPWKVSAAVWLLPSCWKEMMWLSGMERLFQVSYSSTFPESNWCSLENVFKSF